MEGKIMAYECQNFCNGQKLKAEQLNKMEQAIADMVNNGGSGNPDGSGATSWNDLSDKPFSVLEPAKIVTLTFDGSLDGREHVDLSEVSAGYFYVKLSDDIPDKEAFLGQTMALVFGAATSTVTVDDAFLNSYCADMTADTEGVTGSAWAIQYNGCIVMVVAETMTQTYGTYTITLEPGIWISYFSGGPYYVSSLTYKALEVIQHLDEKFIPDTIARVSEVKAVEAGLEGKLKSFGWADLKNKPFEDAAVLYEWDENVTYETYETDASGDRYDRISANTPGFSLSGYKHEIVGKLLALTTRENDELVTSTVEITEDMITRYKTSDTADWVYSINGIIYLVYGLDASGEINDAYGGTWCHSQSNGENLYANVQILEPVKPLDDKFIPDTVCKDGDKEFILSSSTEGSTKKFKITVDDSGTLSVTEVIAEE